MDNQHHINHQTISDILGSLEFMKGLNIERESSATISTTSQTSFKAVLGLLSPIKRKEANKYFAPTDEASTYLHFTSIPVLLSILHERGLRLYNLFKTDDESELAFSAKYFTSNAFNEIAKMNTFILSLTKKENLLNAFFWENYADKCKGVCLEISFEVPEENWKAFHISPVYYGELPSRENWLQQVNQIQQLPNILDFQFDASRVFSLQKKSCYSIEEEVRLFTYMPFSGNSMNANPTKYIKTYCSVDQNILDREGRNLHPLKSKISFIPLPFECNDRMKKNTMPNSYHFVPTGFPRLKLKKIWLNPDVGFELEKRLVEISQRRIGHGFVEKVKQIGN